MDTNDTAPKPHFLKHLKSSARRELRQQIRDEWEREWQIETRGRTTYTLTPTPTRDILQLHTSAHNALSSVIIQMRTGKIGLRQFLFDRKVPEIPNPQYECGRGNQSVPHILLACEEFKDLRREIWEGSNGRRTRMDLREILNTPNKAKKVARFTILTRLLRQ
jgi:hypothetical protein